MIETDREGGPAMWAQLVIDTIRRPRAAAARVLALPIGADALASAALAVVTLGMLVTYLAVWLLGAPAEPLVATLLSNPLLGALVQLGGLALTVVLTHLVGRLFGGHGDLDGALRVVVWLNVVVLIFQALEVLFALALPPFAAPLSLLVVMWLLWAYSSFAAELHGFTNVLPVAAITIATGLVLAFGAAMLLAAIGVVPQGAG